LILLLILINDGVLGAASLAGFPNRFFHCFAGFASAFLNPAQQFFLFSVQVLEIVVG
jgi:hypothetical protein